MTGLKATASGPLASMRSCSQSPPPKATRAQRDAVLLEAQREMPAGGADALGRLGQADVGGAQHRPLVAVAEGGEAFDLPHGLMRERGERRLGVDEQLGDRDLPARCAARRRRRNRCGTASIAASSIVRPAAASWPPWPTQVLAAGGQRRVQIEAVDAAAGAHGRLRAQLVERDQHDGPMIFFGEPAGDDADHARVPAAAGRAPGPAIAVGSHDFAGLACWRRGTRSAPAFAAAR